MAKRKGGASPKAKSKSKRKQKHWQDASYADGPLAFRDDDNDGLDGDDTYPVVIKSGKHAYPSTSGASKMKASGNGTTFGGGFINSGSGGSAYSGHNQSYTYKSCGHSGNVRVFAIDGRHVYGAGSSIRFAPTTDLVIDLANSYPNGSKPAPLPKSASSFIGHATDADLKALWPTPPPPAPPPKPRRLDLNWPDMQAPDIECINVDFWRLVWSIMPVVEEGTPLDQAKHTIICCMGGHGRTGTAMAALLIANCGFSRANAINFVRYHHCTKAVESTSQFDYLKALAVQAGTSTQPLDENLIAKLEALEPGKGSLQPSKQTTIWPGPTQGTTPSAGPSAPLWTPPASSTPTPSTTGVINQPLSEAEIAARKQALLNDTNWDDDALFLRSPDLLGRATFFCVQDKDSLVWVSKEVFHQGTYGDPNTIEILGVRLV